MTQRERKLLNGYLNDPRNKEHNDGKLLRILIQEVKVLRNEVEEVKKQLSNSL